MYRFTDRVPIPPKCAKKHRTSCQYCIVGCGYTTYTWPTTVPKGGPGAAQNALGGNLPVSPLTG